jgi:hypothetical protein
MISFFFFIFNPLFCFHPITILFFIKKSEKKLKMDFFFHFSSAKQWRIKKVKGRMRRSMVAMGGHLGNKKKSRILFFLEKGPKKITIFGQKPGKIKKIALPLLFPPVCPPNIFFSSLNLHPLILHLPKRKQPKHEK